jgi:hypothetical protein
VNGFRVNIVAQLIAAVRMPGTWLAENAIGDRNILKFVDEMPLHRFSKRAGNE